MALFDQYGNFINQNGATSLGANAAQLGGGSQALGSDGSSIPREGRDFGVINNGQLTYQQLVDYMRANPNPWVNPQMEDYANLRNVEAQKYTIPGQQGQFLNQDGVDANGNLRFGSPIRQMTGEMDGSWRKYNDYNPDGTIKSGTVEGPTTNAFDKLGMLAVAGIGGAALSGAMGAGAAGAGGGAAGTAGGYAIPTSTELAAGGFGTGGMGLTGGAGAIGAAPSVVGAGAGAAGYGSAAAGLAGAGTAGGAGTGATTGTEAATLGGTGTGSATGSTGAAGTTGAATTGGSTLGGQAASVLGNKAISTIAGGLLGGAASGSGKDASSTTGPPSYAVPYITDAMKRAQDLANKPYEAYTGNLNAGQNDYEKQANSALTGWAGGTDQSRQASGIYSDMAGGKNPYATTANTMNASLASSNQASNPYIGQQSAGISGVGSVAGAAKDALNNPYLGQNVGAISGANAVSAGKNPMLGMNTPYLNNAIDQAQGDVVRNYNLAVRPQEDARMARSGSFGNTGLQQMEQEGQRNLAGQLGNISTNMRMQDYGAQQQLNEADVGRRLGADQFNANNQQGTQQFNAGLMGNNIARNLAGTQFNSGQMLDAAKFDANTGLNTQQFNANLGQNDLSRNSSLAQSLGQFNAGVLNNNSQFNAGANNTANAFNTNAMNNNNQFNAQMGYNTRAAGLAGLNQMDQRQLQGGNVLGALGQNQRALDQQKLDTQYQQWLRQQGYPQQQQQNYLDSIRGLTFGSTSSQQAASNPLLGVLGGAQVARSLFPNGFDFGFGNSGQSSLLGNQVIDPYSYDQNYG